MNCFIDITRYKSNPVISTVSGQLAPCLYLNKEHPSASSMVTIISIPTSWWHGIYRPRVGMGINVGQVSCFTGLISRRMPSNCINKHEKDIHIDVFLINKRHGHITDVI